MTHSAIQEYLDGRAADWMERVSDVVKKVVALIGDTACLLTWWMGVASGGRNSPGFSEDVVRERGWLP